MKAQYPHTLSVRPQHTYEKHTTSLQKEKGNKKPQLHRLPCLLVLCLLSLLTIAAAPLKYTEDRLPSTLNPLYADDMYSVRITELLFERLIGWDQEQRPTPMLAVKWKFSPQKTSITFTLRQGVTWHDGKPFSARDVAFTIKAMTSRKSQLHDRYLAQIIARTRIISPTQLQLHFKKRMNKPLSWLRFPILPAHRFKGRLPKRSNYFAQKPYGTGPFRFVRWSGKQIILKRWHKHWRAKQTKLKGIRLQAIPDKNIQTEVLRFGGLDTIVRARPKDLPLFEKSQNIRLYPYSTNDWWYIGFNLHKGSPLRDLRLRQALVYAIDRESLRNAHLGDGQTISGPFSPNDPLYNFEVTPRTQDRQKAAKLLDAAGWKLPKRKGKKTPIRRKGKKRLRLRLVLPRSKSSYRNLVLAIRSSYRRLGIDVQPVWLPDAAWTRAIFKQKQFDLTLHIWNFDSLSSIHPLFHSRGSRNYIGFRHKGVDKLLRKATQTTDPLIYKAIYAKLHKTLHTQLPYLFLWSLTNYSAIASRVKHVTIHPFNFFHHASTWQKRSED